MQFSNTTSKNGLVQRCELYTSLGDGAISGDTTLLGQFTGLINSAYQKVSTMILESMDEWDFDDSDNSDFPVATAPMTVNRDYSFPTSILKVKRLDITYDGINWYKAEAFDINEYGFGVGNDVNMDVNFQKTSPKYDTKYNSIWIYPKANAEDVASGASLRMEYSREINEFLTTDTTVEPGIDEPFHPLIAKLASTEWAIIKGLKSKNDLNTLCQEDEARLKRFYGKKQEDRNIILKSVYQDYE